MAASGVHTAPRNTAFGCISALQPSSSLASYKDMVSCSGLAGLLQSWLRLLRIPQAAEQLAGYTAIPQWQDILLNRSGSASQQLEPKRAAEANAASPGVHHIAAAFITMCIVVLQPAAACCMFPCVASSRHANLTFHKQHVNACKATALHACVCVYVQVSFAAGLCRPPHSLQVYLTLHKQRHHAVSDSPEIYLLHRDHTSRSCCSAA
jgi:hypothetical protein